MAYRRVVSGTPAASWLCGRGTVGGVTALELALNLRRPVSGAGTARLVRQCATESGRPVATLAAPARRTWRYPVFSVPQRILTTDDGGAVTRWARRWIVSPARPQHGSTARGEGTRARYKKAVSSAKEARDAARAVPKAAGRAARAAITSARAGAKDAVETAQKVPGNLKDLVSMYGRTALLVYICADLTTLCMSFCAVRYGVDVEAVLGAIGLPFDIASVSGGPLVSSFVIALALNKVTLPFRLAGTAAVVPSIARRLRLNFPEAAAKWLKL